MIWYGWLGLGVLAVDQALLPLQMVHARDVDRLRPVGGRARPAVVGLLAPSRPATGGGLPGDRVDPAVARLRAVQLAPPQLGLFRAPGAAVARRDRLRVA